MASRPPNHVRWRNARVARPWVLGASLVLVLGVLGTVIFTVSQSQAALADRKDAFDQATLDAADRLSGELAGYEDLLYGVRGLLNASADVTPPEFEAFAGEMGNGRAFQSIRSVAIAELVTPDELGAFLAERAATDGSFRLSPAGEREDYRPVVLDFSTADSEESIEGLDIGATAGARATQDLARDTAGPSLSAPFALGESPGATGFSVVLPVYSSPSAPALVADRRAQIERWVSVDVEVDAFLSSALGGQRSLDVSITDVAADEVVGEQTPVGGVRSGFTSTREVRANGRTWRVEFNSLQPFAASSDPAAVLWRVLLPGIAISVAVYLFLSTLGDSRQRAEDLARTAERELRLSESKFRAMFEKAPIGYYLLDDAGAVRAVNPSLCRLLDRESDALLGTRLDDLVHPDDRSGFRRFASSARRDVEAVVGHECRFVRPDGQVRWGSVTVTFTDSLGGEATLIGNVEDTTLRRLHFERLQWVGDYSRRVRSLLDVDEVMDSTVRSIGPELGVDGVHLRLLDDLSPGSHTASWGSERGRAAARAGGRWAEGVVGGSDGGSMRPEQLVVVDDALTDSCVDDAARVAMLEHGVRSILHMPVKVGAGTSAELTVLSLDTPRPWLAHDRFLAEAVSAELGVALANATLYQRERQMVDKLEDLDRTKTDFVSTVSHELRTPLTSIHGYIEMLRDGDAGDLSAAQGDLLEAADRNTGRLMHLIEDLLTLSRVEAGRFRNSVTAVDVRRVVVGALEAVGPAFVGRSLWLHADVPDDLPQLRADERNLERVLINLVGNAVKFTPSGGTVSITARYEVGPVAGRDGSDGGPRIALEVSDTGIGIPVDEQDELFTRFFRSSTSRDLQIQGTGLGLVIVKGIVEAHGGTVDITSAPGAGTTITCRFPLSHPLDEAGPRADGTTAAQRSTDGVPGHEARSLTFHQG